MKEYGPIQAYGSTSNDVCRCPNCQEWALVSQLITHRSGTKVVGCTGCVDLRLNPEYLPWAV